MKTFAITSSLLMGVTAAALAQPQTVPITCADLNSQISAGVYSRCSPATTYRTETTSRTQTQCSDPDGKSVRLTWDTSLASGRKSCSTQLIVPD